MTEQEKATPVQTAVQVRGKIFSTKNKKRLSRFIQFFGAEIELRQPSLGDIAKMNDEGTQHSAIVQTLINYAYIPGTDEKVFDETHADDLNALPFDNNFVRVSEAIRALTQVNVGEVKND